MNSLRFCLFVIVLVIDAISRGHGQLPTKRDEQDVKKELLKLLIPREGPEVVEDPSVELKKSNLIDTLLYQYFPIYKSPQDNANNFENPINNDGRDGKFTNTRWLTFDGEDSRGAMTNDLFRKNTNFLRKDDDNNFEIFNPGEKSHQYEVKEEREGEPEFPFVHHNHNNHQYHPALEQNFEHTKHGSYQGSGLYYHHSHYHHNHDHYNEHNPGCFPHRRRPPPRPRPTTTTASSASETVDPRIGTVAGFMATQVPRIDIRGLI